MAPLLQATGIGKTYPGGVVANDGVNLTVSAGEVHAVVGENGAGKSTLMKILFGIERPDAGELTLDGKPVSFANPRDAIEAGIGMVFQHFSLVPSFSVYENVVLGSEPRSGARFDRKRAIEEVRALSKRFRLKVDPLPAVGTLPVGQQQRVEILKALYRDARILILDEPTAVLAPQEVEELFIAVRELVAQGRTVIFIAHKLPEVLEISDRITVMLATMMVGRDVALRVDRAATAGALACEIKALWVRSESGQPLLEDLNLRVHAGEIVGLVGVEGNGQAALIDAISGAGPMSAGVVYLNGTSLGPLSTLERRAIGVANIPEDRIAQGLAGGASVAENLVATKLGDRRYVRRGLLDLRAIKANAEALIARYSVRVGGADQAVATLSGGNMQKVVVARELSEQPKLLLVSQPTRGVDLGATQFIWRSLTDARDAGAAVLLSSADLTELLALSDRLVVFYRGKLVAAFHNDDTLTPEILGSYMLGLAVQTQEEVMGALR